MLRIGSKTTYKMPKLIQVAHRTHCIHVYLFKKIKLQKIVFNLEDINVFLPFTDWQNYLNDVNHEAAENLNDTENQPLNWTGRRAVSLFGINPDLWVS